MCLVNSFKDVQFVKIDQIVQSLFRIFQLIYNAHTTTFDISIVCIILLHNQIKSKSKSSAHLFDVFVLHTAILLSFSFVLAKKKNQIQVRKHSSLRVKLWSDIQNVFIDCFFTISDSCPRMILHGKLSLYTKCIFTPVQKFTCW